MTGRDRSEGWEAVADQFVAARSNIGAALVRSWARKRLPPAAEIVDVGCGSGVPIAQTLVDAGHSVAGIDASPTLLAAFRRRFPDAPAACEAAQDSRFFDRQFDGAVAVGLLFLLSPDDQRRTLARIAAALRPGGRLLFSAPRQICSWDDLLTGRRSRSLGEQAYAALLADAGLHLVECLTDEGETNYYDAARPPAGATARRSAR